jgi:hypothetical protein
MNLNLYNSKSYGMFPKARPHCLLKTAMRWIWWKEHLHWNLSSVMEEFLRRLETILRALFSRVKKKWAWCQGSGCYVKEIPFSYFTSYMFITSTLLINVVSHEISVKMIIMGNRELLWKNAVEATLKLLSWNQPIVKSVIPSQLLSMIIHTSVIQL